MEISTHFNFKNILNNRYNRLTVIGYFGKSKNRYFWKCLCDCGNYAIVDRGNLIPGHSQSCGCFKKELIKKSSITHGLSKTKEYAIWADIKKRCYNKNNSAYKFYGAKGITMCNKWKNSFIPFITDMGKRPSENHSIDRINTFGNYEPSNCRWTTKDIQSNNTRTNKKITLNGITKNITQWLKLLNIPCTTYYNRLNRNWSIQDALTKPCKYRMKSSKILISEKTLYNLYINKKVSSSQIAKKLKVSKKTILNRLHEYNIPIRILLPH